MAQGSPTCFDATTVGCRQALGYAAIFSLFINVLQLTVPIYMMQLLDRVLSSQSYETLGWLSVLAVLALMSMVALEIVRARLTLRAGTWFERRLGFATFEQGVLRALAKKTHSIDALGDLSTVRSFLSSTSLNALFDSPWVPAYLLLIFLLHPALGLVATMGALVLFALAVMSEVVTRRPMQRAAMVGQRSFAGALAATRNAEVACALGMVPGLAARWFSMHNDGLTSHQNVGDKTASIHAASKLTRFLVQISILGVGTVLVISEEITPGVMIAGSIIMARALSPVEQAIGSWKNLVLARSAFGRLKAVFDEAGPQAENMELPAPTGQLNCENLTLFFPDADEPVIRGVTFGCEPGDALAIVGPSGSGKSTLIRMIMGVIKPTRGVVRLDGADITSWNRTSLGPHLGYLPQDVELFAGTVQENIARMAAVIPDKVIEAAKTAGIHDRILGLPRGYDTHIHADGTNLSGGERQLIGLARALYGQPCLVVMDEPNANLDGEGEQMLAKAIVSLRRAGATVIVVSHRSSILRVVNKVLVLRNGAVEMAGATEQVIARLTRSSEPATKDTVPDQRTETEVALGMTSTRPVSIQGGKS